MNTPKPTIPKWPFFLGDLSLILFGFTLFLKSNDPLNLWALFSAIVCIILGAVILIMPYVLEFKNDTKQKRSSSTEDVDQLKTVVNAFITLHEEREKQLEIQDKHITILESLLKRMEARLRGDTTIVDEINTIPQQTIVDFDEAVNPEMDVELEMDPDFFDSELDELSESVSDTAAKITVNVQMGIGSKPYIRGDGPGLSWETGQPLEFDSIGKWSWTVDPIDTPFQYQIYKNDESVEKDEPHTIAPGEHQNIHPSF